MTNDRPGSTGTQPAPTTDPPWKTLLRVHEESLQSAVSVDHVVGIIRRALEERPELGKGAIFVPSPLGEPELAVGVEGPRSADLSAPLIELTGIARRALREREAVRQSGVSVGLLWARPLKSSDGIEAVVAAVGDDSGWSGFFTHAAHAYARERQRQADTRLRRATEERALELERAVEILDSIAREGGTDPVVRRVACAMAGTPGIGRVRLWMLRVEDGVFVEVARAEDGRGDRGADFAPPRETRSAEGFHRWHGSLPRWGGFAWWSGGAVPRPKPGPGDVLVIRIPSADERTTSGFFLAEIAESLGDASPLADLSRWAAIGRLAIQNRIEQTRTLRSLEELRAEREQIAELHKMKSQFIAAVSHELRTPLTSITAYSETLRSTNIQTDDATRDRFLRVIHDESRRLTRIVDDILDLAMMDSGRVRMSCRAIDVARVLRDALDVIEPIAAEKGITIAGPESEPVHLHADPDLLKQLTVNLLENAVKFSGHGTGVRIELECESSSVRIVVTDEGPGIPADRLDLIFLRFYQVDGSNSRAHGGSGLGLAICRSIATWHDGRIWAESELGKGARFVVSLPRTRATSRERAMKPILNTEPAITHVLPELIIEMVAEMMNSETVSLMLVDGHELFIQAAMGIPDEAIREVRMAIGDRIAGTVAETGEALHIADLAKDGRFGPPAAEGQYRTRSILSVPVKVRSQVIGVINVTNKRSGSPFTTHDRRLLEMFAQRVALMLNKIREFGDQREGVERMEEAIRGVIDVRRHYFSSSGEITELILGVCRELRIPEDDTARIHYAWILKDVGMMRLPDGVYKKPAELSHEDWELVRRHPEEGAKVLRSIEFQPEVFDMVMFHHEEPDGTGYPRGLTDAGIPLGAKVLAVVDAYHALRSGRPYRKAVGAGAAVEELRRNVGKQFDPIVVEALVRVLESRGEVRACASELEGEVQS